MPLSRRELLLASTGLLAACVRGDVQKSGPRFVSASLSSDEILWALGEKARAQMVGVSALVDDERYSGVANRWPQDLPRVAGKAEEVLALEPSLVFLSAYSVPETAAVLRSSGVEVAMLGSCDGLADFRMQILQVASACRMSPTGDALVRVLDRQCDALRARTAQIRRASGDHLPRVLCIVGDLVPGKGTTFDDVCGLAGVRNVAADANIKGWSPLKDELLLTWNPDYILVPCVTECDADAQAVRARPGAGELRAAVADQVLALPQSMVSSSSAAMLDLAATIQTRIFALDVLPAFRLEGGS